jgi:hypothetical protein
MRHKSILISLGIFLFVVCTAATVLVLLVRHVPGFYRRAAVPPGPARVAHSKAFQAECAYLYNSIHAQKKWTAVFTESQINSYFEEHFILTKNHEVYLSPGLSAPRVALESDRIRLAFRYGKGSWSTIISVNLRVWLPKKEPNVIALELQGLHAGSLPISSQSLLDHISEICQRQSIDVKWHRYKGNPVALLRFPSNPYRPTVQLSQLELRPGMLVVGVRAASAPSHGLASTATVSTPTRN